MEEVQDFDKWITEQASPIVEYYAVYDNNTGEIKGIYPDHAASNEIYKVKIESNIADDIFSGILNTFFCWVDLESQTFQIGESKNLIKIDQLLHRIIEEKYSTEKNFDVYITYHREEEKLIFELAEKYYGTKKNLHYSDLKKKKSNWNGDLEMNFYITRYNDPNVLNYVVSLKIDDLFEKQKVVEGVQLSERFSIYTRRLLKEYRYEEV
jgi:hypothetical protein